MVRSIERAYVIDILVEDLVVIEVKAVEALLPVHLAQRSRTSASRKSQQGCSSFNVKR